MKSTAISGCAVMTVKAFFRFSDSMTLSTIRDFSSRPRMENRPVLMS